MRNVAGVLLALTIGWVIFMYWPRIIAVLSGPRHVACTMEAKICPDGIAVGRTGPNCEFTACPGAPATASGDITLGVGGKGKVGDLEITLNSVGEDSRCPADVQCIWAGTVNLNVTLKSGAYSETKDMSSNAVPQRFDAYQVSVVGVAPARVSGRKILPYAYRITFHVSK